MSAILEALKKLEQESSEPSGHPLHREIEHNGKWRKTLLSGVLAVGVIIICGFAGYGVVVLTRKTPVSPEAAVDGNIAAPSRTAKIFPAPESPPAVQPVPNPVMAPPSLQNTAPAKTETPRHSEIIPPPARDFVAVALPEDLSPEPVEETLPPQEPPPAEPADELIPETENALAGRPESDGVANTAPEIIPERLPDIINDPEAVLQAISWSQDAGRRMAVINGKICREREPIGGYVILKINPEDVVVSKGSVTGRLVFKIH